jgi:hypothetical protein
VPIWTEENVLTIFKEKGWKVIWNNPGRLTLEKYIDGHIHPKWIHICKEKGEEGYITNTHITPDINTLLYHLFEAWECDL